MKRQCYIALVGDAAVAAGVSPRAAAEEAASRLGALYAMGLGDVEDIDGLPIDVRPGSREECREASALCPVGVLLALVDAAVVATAAPAGGAVQ